MTIVDDTGEHTAISEDINLATDEHEEPKAEEIAPPPIPAYRFVIVDLTTDATPENLKPTPDALSAIIIALAEQVSGPWAKAYGFIDCNFRVAADPNDRQEGEIAINLRDTIPEAPTAIAYHQVTNGIPDIEVGVDLVSDLFMTQDSLSVAMSHETLETLLDPGANQWVDKQDGSGLQCAKEAADVVQNTGYQASNGVMVSNFLLPSYWMPMSNGPWDYLGVMSNQRDVSNGYEITTFTPQAIQADTSDVKHHRKWGHMVWSNNHASLTKNAISRKAKPTSRTARRGVRL